MKWKEPTNGLYNGAVSVEEKCNVEEGGGGGDGEGRFMLWWWSREKWIAGRERQIDR